jgi:hypothetical protein
MKTNQLSPGSSTPTLAETACGARVMINPHTPFITYRDEIVYFCGEDCRQLYEDNKYGSCMAACLLSGK